VSRLFYDEAMSNAAPPIAVASDKLWKRFCEAIARPELTNHPDYHSNPLRVQNRDVLERLLEGVLYAARRVLGALSRHGVPCTLVYNCTFGIPRRDRFASSAWRSGFSDTPRLVRSAAPLLGADSTATLRALLGAGGARCGCPCGEMIVRP
jgi:crotonobetainyl-CoA:carnitine CoA-transferase CaiB-like acyl-CoA transferase